MKLVDLALRCATDPRAVGTVAFERFCAWVSKSIADDHHDPRVEACNAGARIYDLQQRKAAR